MLNKLYSIFFVGGLVLLAFVGGAISAYYKLPISVLISNAITSAEAWHEVYTAPPPLSPANISQHKSKKYSVSWNKDKALNGYTLIARKLKQSVQLVRMDGVPIHRWHVDFHRIWRNPQHINNTLNSSVNTRFAHVFPNGDLLVLFSGENDSPYGYGLAKLDKDSNVIWKYTANAHHHFHIDRTDGDIYTLTHEMVKRPIKGAEKLPFPMLTDYIVRLSPEGKEIEKLSILEAFVRSDYLPMLYYKNTRPKWDHLHTNSIAKLDAKLAHKFPMFKPGHLLISLRNSSIIAVIDPKAKKVVWAHTGHWKLQHDVNFTPDGHLIMFDNQGHVIADKKSSRILILDPKTLQTVWYYAGDKKRKFYSDTRSGVQLLYNNNMLVTSTKQRNVFEVTPNHEIVWDYKIPAKNSQQILSAHRYTLKDIPFIVTQ